MKLKAKAPLDKLDEKLQFKKEIANNRLSLCLPEFIELLPVDVSEHNSRFPAFYRLVEEYGLVVNDKTVDGQIVSSFELLAALQQRDQHAYDSFDDYDFDYWGALTKERKYNVERDDVATAYDKAGKTEFPWLSMEGNPVSLNTVDHAKVESTEHELHFEKTERRYLNCIVPNKEAKRIESQQTKDWKILAVEIGTIWMNEQRSLGNAPGVDAIAKHVSAEFKTKDIRGKRDDYLSWNTIKKEALTGITGKKANGK